MKRYNMNFNRKKLSPDEMTKYMNFDKFINGAPAPAAKGIFGKAGAALKWGAVTGLAAITAVTLYFFAGSSKDIPAKAPFIDPPLAGVEIRSTAFTIDPTRDTTLVYETGSTIIIPANVFADQQGNAVTGNIELRYREFHDPYEILLSGIPMHYDSAGTHYTFESGGMFELLALKDGKPLDMLPGKQVTVNLISLTSDEDFNMYFLDTTRQCWTYLGENDNQSGNNHLLYDSVLAKKYTEKMLGIEEPVRIVKADPNAQNFMIDYSKEEFPELAVFDGVRFQVDPTDKSYDTRLAEKVWEDVSISRKDKKYSVTFSRGKESYSFAVTPVVEEKDYPQFKKELDRKMALYTIAMNERKEKEKDREAILKANYQTLVASAKWENVGARINNMMKRNPVNYPVLAMRTFGIESPGIYNLDRPRTFFSESRWTNAKLYDKSGKPVDTYKVYLLIKGKNTVYSYGCMNNEVMIQFGKDDPNFIVATTTDGLLAYMDTEEFRKAVSSTGKGAELKMNVQARRIESVEELKQLLNN